MNARTPPFIVPDTISVLPGVLPLRLALNYARRVCTDADVMLADVPTYRLVWNADHTAVVALTGQTGEGGTLRVELDHADDGIGGGDIGPTHILITRWNPHQPERNQMIQTVHVRLGQTIREKITC